MKGKKRHDFIYWFGRLILYRPLARKFSFKCDDIKVEHSPYIVIANHLTNWDPLLIGMSFRKNMYYVASDHILRMGLKSKILEFVIAPIARAKTAQETQTVINIFRRLKAKCNICIFAEGTTSFDGKTGDVPPSMAKLVKRAGVALVTYRFTGAYFTIPRWTRNVRKGKMEGRLVRIYSPDEIASMSEDEIYQAIIKDIYVNAYDDQEKNKQAFRGKNLAEHLETILYCCPECKQFGTLKSCNDILSCVACGFKVRYNEYGYFEAPNSSGKPPEFKTILDWVKWEREEINALALKDLNADGALPVPLFTDEDQELYETARASHNILISKGKLEFSRNKLSVGQVEFSLDEIIEMGVITMKTVVFAVKDKVYEIHSKHPRSALKYMDIFNVLKNKK